MESKMVQLDFPADDKETKKTARVMLQMVAPTINHDYISKRSTQPPIRVQCVTCHHGLTQPRTLNSVLAEAIDQKGVDAAMSLYRDLRQKYYGTGQYDFGETPLNQLCESLLADNSMSMRTEALQGIGRFLCATRTPALGEVRNDVGENREGGSKLCEGRIPVRDLPEANCNSVVDVRAEER
jgi:hypothetical protein